MTVYTSTTLIRSIKNNLLAAARASRASNPQNTNTNDTESIAIYQLTGLAVLMIMGMALNCIGSFAFPTKSLGDVIGYQVYTHLGTNTLPVITVLIRLVLYNIIELQTKRSTMARSVKSPSQKKSFVHHQKNLTKSHVASLGNWNRGFPMWQPSSPIPKYKTYWV